VGGARVTEASSARSAVVVKRGDFLRLLAQYPAAIPIYSHHAVFPLCQDWRGPTQERTSIPVPKHISPSPQVAGGGAH